MVRPTETDITLVSVYLATGSTKEAAAALGIRDATYRHRLGRIYRKHGVANMAQLVYHLRAELTDVTDAPLVAQVAAADD